MLRSYRQGWTLSMFGRGASVADEAGHRLTEFVRAFEDINHRTEPDFNALGRTLRGLHSVAKDMTELVRGRAEGLRGALVTSRFAGADGLAAQSLAELRATLEETSRLLHSLESVGNALHQLQVQVQGIHRIGVFLKTSVLNFAVESVRTPECHEAFGAFVDELRTLANRIAALGENINDEVKTSQSTQALRFGSISTGLDEMRRLAKNLEQTSNRTASEAQELLDSTCVALQEAEDSALQIGRHADEAVYQLQFGDIVRQKNEHVIASLEEAVDLASKAAWAKDSGAICAAADNVLAIQIRQIDSVREEVLGAHCKLATAFEGIASETSRLSQALQRGQETACLKGSGKDPLEALSANTLRVERLLQEGRKLGEDARNTAREAVESSARLGQHLDELQAINREMHLQALNAIIKTAALGQQGATLEVLSMEVDRLFRDSNREVDQIIVTLQAVLAQAAEGVSESQTITFDTRIDVDHNGGLREGLERITQAYRQFRETSGQSQTLAHKQQSALSASSVDLQFLPTLADSLAHQVESLDSVRQLLAAKAIHAEQPPAQMVGSLEQRYTMQSERDIHELFSKGSLPPATSLEQPPLPLEPSVVANQIAQATHAPLAHPADGKPGGEDQPPSETKEAAPGFGDNVELF